MKFEETITYIQLNDHGQIVYLGGSFKTKDIKVR
jgi:hypothetical protein